MKIELVLKRRDGKANATGVYEDGNVIVRKGSLINLKGSELSDNSTALKFRLDRSIVGDDGIVKRDVLFKSASMAATFVSGCVTNGLKYWKTRDGKRLSDCIRKKPDTI